MRYGVLGMIQESVMKVKRMIFDDLYDVGRRNGLSSLEIVGPN